MPRNRLILRQILLSLSSLSMCLSAWVLVGVLTGAGVSWLAVVSVVPILAGLLLPVMVWFTGEDRRDRGAGWFAAIGLVTLVFAVTASLAVPAGYQELAGRPVPVVVTAGDNLSRDGYQLVTVETTSTGEELGEVLFFADRDLRAGDRLVAMVDPLGWFPLDTAQPPPGRKRTTGILAVVGSVLLAILTVLRVRRDLHRYDFTGSRRPR